MLVVPVGVGVVLAGPAWWHALLLVTWLAAYLAFHATGLWLRSRRRPRYWPPVRAYGVVTLVLGLSVLVARPGLVRWAVVYLPLLTVSLWLSARRRDRSTANDLITIGAACLMTVLVGGTWTAAGVCFLYFAGTVFYVKTMIRDRGSRPMLVASMSHHALATIAVWFVSPWLGGLFVLLTARAGVVPVARPRTTPKQLGLGEVVASVALGVTLVAVL